MWFFTILVYKGLNNIKFQANPGTFNIMRITRIYSSQDVYLHIHAVDSQNYWTFTIAFAQSSTLQTKTFAGAVPSTVGKTCTFFKYFTHSRCIWQSCPHWYPLTLTVGFHSQFDGLGVTGSGMRTCFQRHPSFLLSMLEKAALSWRYIFNFLTLSMTKIIISLHLHIIKNPGKAKLRSWKDDTCLLVHVARAVEDDIGLWTV